MKLTNVGAFDNIEDFVSWKLNKFQSEQKTFCNLFANMFLEESNVMAETTDGYRIKKLTYGEVRQRTLKRATVLCDMLGLERGSLVGIYMDNSVDWIELFWGTLAIGMDVILLNKRLPAAVIDQIVAENGVCAVISDDRRFSVKTVICSEIGYGESLPLGQFGERVIFISSGTSERVKLCSYTAENFYYQICNSLDIVKKCPAIAGHYKGELKQLALLPFYHVFGFIAVYMWFGFFSRTFVFVKDLNPSTIAATIKKHEVTHLFAVPLVWETAYKAAMRKIAERGEKTVRKVKKGIKIAVASRFGAIITRKAMGEIRERLFGDSVLFMISGGSAISREALEFFNGIGYRLASGYGMTEVGITSLQMSNKALKRCSGSVGMPFKHTEYSINEEGELLIKGKNIASTITVNGEVQETDGWYNSHDLVSHKKEGYFILGRRDDLIVPESGENINPVLIEQKIAVPGVDEVCLTYTDRPTLVLSSKRCYSEKLVTEMLCDAKRILGEHGLLGVINKIVLTPDSLIRPNEFKLSRKGVAKRLMANELTLIDEGSVGGCTARLADGLTQEVTAIFAEATRKSAAEIGENDNFFTDLGGSSLDYFILADMIKAKYDVDVKSVDGSSLATVSEVCLKIKNTR